MSSRCTECGRPLTVTTKMIGETYSAFSADWELVAEYIDLFQCKQRPRELRLLQELVYIWTKHRFMYHGKAYRIGQRGVVDALKTTCDEEPVGIKTHNYLKKVMISLLKKSGARYERIEDSRRRGRAGRKWVEQPEAEPVGKIVGEVMEGVLKRADTS